MRKIIIVNSYGKLPIHGGINGPITTPVAMDVRSIVNMLNRGITEIYEINPYNVNEKIKITRQNCGTVNFKPKDEASVVYVTPDNIPKDILEDVKKNEVTEEIPFITETEKVSNDISTKAESKEVETSNKVEDKKEPEKKTGIQPSKKEDMKKIDNDFVSNSKKKK